MEAEPDRSDRHSIKGLHYEELQPLLADVSFSQLSVWGREASPEDLESAAHGLMRATDPDDQFRHLRLFFQRAFPLEPTHLLALARSSNDRLAHAAHVAISEVRHPEVRAFAMALIAEQAEHRTFAIDMLCHNFEPGDHEFVLRWFAAEGDRETRHSTGWNLQDFWREHPDPATEVRMLEALYERGTCSHCRGMAVLRLVELDALSPAMLKECAFDANDDIRELVLPLL